METLDVTAVIGKSQCMSHARVHHPYNIVWTVRFTGNLPLGDCQRVETRNKEKYTRYLPVTTSCIDSSYMKSGIHLMKANKSTI